VRKTCLSINFQRMDVIHRMLDSTAEPSRMTFKTTPYLSPFQTYIFISFQTVKINQQTVLVNHNRVLQRDYYCRVQAVSCCYYTTRRSSQW
jgi:hypothetical protein